LYLTQEHRGSFELLARVSILAVEDVRVRLPKQLVALELDKNNQDVLVPKVRYFST
jgi:hypothetical protein